MPRTKGPVGWRPGVLNDVKCLGDRGLVSFTDVLSDLVCGTIVSLAWVLRIAITFSSCHCVLVRCCGIGTLRSWQRINVDYRGFFSSSITLWISSLASDRLFMMI